MSIKFTQYLLPKGNTKELLIDMPAHIEEMAHELEKHGYKFEIEILTTGVVSMTCEPIGDEGLLDIQLCNNGPEVPQAVERLVLNSYRAAGLSQKGE